MDGAGVEGDAPRGAAVSEADATAALIAELKTWQALHLSTLELSVAALDDCVRLKAERDAARALVVSLVDTMHRNVNVGSRYSWHGLNEETVVAALIATDQWAKEVQP